MLSITNLSWKEDYDEFLALDALRACNLKYIELSLTRKFKSWENITSSKLKDYNSYLLDKNLKICSLQSILFGKDYNLFINTNDFKDHFKMILDYCDILQVDYVVFGSPKSRDKRDINIQLCDEIFIDTFTELCDYNPNVTIGIETNPKYYNCNYLTNYLDCTKIIKNVNKSNLKFHLDLACVELEGDDYNQIYDKEKNNLKIIHLTVKDLKCFYNNDILKQFYIKNKNNSNIFSIEMLNQEFVDIIKTINFLNYE